MMRKETLIGPIGKNTTIQSILMGFFIPQGA